MRWNCGGRHLRKRWQWFVDAFLKELAKDGMDVESAALRAGRSLAWMANGTSLLNDKLILRRAKAILAQPDVTDSIRQYFEIAAGFTAVDAAKKLVAWIDGTVTFDEVQTDEQGNQTTVTIPLPPSLEALKVYLAAALPRQTKRVEIDQRTLVGRVSIGNTEPKIRTRTLPALK